MAFMMKKSRILNLAGDIQSGYIYRCALFCFCQKLSLTEVTDLERSIFILHKIGYAIKLQKLR